VVGLLGPNGAGKTTTLKCIVGLLRKAEGTITIDGMDHRSDVARAKLAYIPEVPDIYEGLTVWDHLKIALAYNLHDWEKRANDLIHRFDLMEKRNELGMHLSKGMKQKTMICCALLHDPDVLLFDEPLIGLDPKAVHELKEVFMDLDTAQNLCDRVLVMKSGKLIAEGTIDDLRKRVQAAQESTLEELFLEKVIFSAVSELSIFWIIDAIHHPAKLAGLVVQYGLQFIWILPFLFKRSDPLESPWYLSLDVIGSVIMALLLLIFLGGLNKASVSYAPGTYTMADANLLFPSPINQRSEPSFIFLYLDGCSICP